MKLRIRRVGRQASGETMIEFALASTMFFMIVFGIIQFGLAVWNYNTLSSLAQEGARWAAVRGSACSGVCTQATTTNVQDYVRARVLGMSPTSVDVTTTWPDGNNNAGSTVQVRVDYTFPLFTKVVRTTSLALHSIAQMKISQ